MRKLLKCIQKCVIRDSELAALVREIDQTKSKQRLEKLENKVARRLAVCIVRCMLK